MRRNLTSCIIAIALCAVGSLAQASDLTDLLLGRHKEYREAGITVAVDLRAPARWTRSRSLNSDPGLSVRYWKEGTAIFRGETMDISVLLMTGNDAGRKFKICVSDPSYRVDEQVRDKRVRNLGGLRVIGSGTGKAGHVTLDTDSMRPGTYFLYVQAERALKADKFAESAVALQITDSLPDVIAAMQGAPAETLKNWGLEESEEEIPPERTRSSRRDSEELRDDARVERVEREDEPNFANGATIYLGRRGEKGFVLQQTVRAGSFPTTVNTGDTLAFGRNAEARVIGINPDRKTITAIVSGRVQQGDPIKVVRGGSR